MSDLASMIPSDLHGVIVNLISDACIRTGAGIIQHVKAAGTKAKSLDRLARGLLETSNHLEVSLASLVELLPASVRAVEVREMLESFEVQTLVQQYTAAVLLDEEQPARHSFVGGLQDVLNDRLALDVTSAHSVAANLGTLLCTSVREAIDASGWSASKQHELALLASVTLLRAQVASLRRDHSKNTSTSEEREDWVHRYRAQCVAAHGFITPPDFKERSKVPLDKIYVPARCRLEDDSRSVTSVFDLVGTLNRDVLLGNPGGGKSTAANVIVHTLASDGSARVPFLVVLREYADSAESQSIVEFIEGELTAYYQCPPPSGVVDLLLRNGSAAVIFDGLDELLDTTFRNAITQRVELFGEAFPNAPILVTSREVGYKEARLDPHLFTTRVIENFAAGDVARYVGNWFEIQDLPVGEGQVLATSFLEDSQSVQDLSASPLMLALMCIIYRSQRYLPKNRTGVYEACSRLLFETWDKSRGIEVQLDFDVHLDAALKHVAYWMFTRPNVADGARRRDLIAEVKGFFAARAYEHEWEAEAAATSFVDFCKGRAWVLSDAGTTESGEELYKFTHQTFMEYFAAYHLTRKYPRPGKLVGKLAPHVARAEWDVVAQLAVHLLEKNVVRGGELALTKFLQRARGVSAEERTNLLGFVARTVEYLPVPPGLLRDICIAALEDARASVHRGISAINSIDPAPWKILSTVEHSSFGVVVDQMRISIEALLGAEGSVDNLTALHILEEIPRAGGWSTSAERTRMWQVFSQEVLLAQKHRILALTCLDDYWAHLMLLHGALSFDEYYRIAKKRGDAPLDPLFRSPANPLMDNHRFVDLVTILFLDVVGIDAGRHDIGALRVRVAGQVIDGVRRIVGRNANGPFVRRLGKGSRGHVFSRGERPDAREPAPSDTRVMLLLYMIHVEALIGLRIPVRYDGPASRSILARLARSVDRNQSPVGPLAALLADSNDPAADVLRRWYSGQVRLLPTVDVGHEDVQSERGGVGGRSGGFGQRNPSRAES